MEEEFDYIDGWNGGVLGGRLQREGICLHIWLFHDVIEQKLIQHCKAITYIYKYIYVCVCVYIYIYILKL